MQIDPRSWQPFVYNGQWLSGLAPGGFAVSPFEVLCYRLIWVVDGTVSVEGHPDGSRRSIRPGQGLICDPGWRLDWSPGAHFIRISFDLFPRPRRSSRYKTWTMDNLQPQPPLTDWLGPKFDGSIPEALHDRTQEMAYRMVRLTPRAPWKVCKASMQLGLWFCELAELVWQPADADDDDDGDVMVVDDAPSPQAMARAVEQYIDEHYYRQIQLQDLGREFGYNPSYLGTAYRRLRGITPMQFLRQVRLKYARELLQQDSCSLEEVARRVGYLNPRSFRAAFQAEVGMSPSAWRRLGK